jgi:thiamine-monophosphate kinase
VETDFFNKKEYAGLAHLYKHSPKNRHQKNGFNTSDVETIKLSKNQFMVVSTDSIAVEIHSGLYQHPETWGYLAIANSVSDLAASGAEPIGMTISAQWKRQHNGKIKDQVYDSMAKALSRFKVPLLGGDSGSSDETVLTTTVLGQSKIKPLDRIGVRSGDLILLFGDFLGYGPAVAYDYLKNQRKGRLENIFRPLPKWQTLSKFRTYFSASIDTSDGIYNALDTLARLNNVAFPLDLNSFRFSSAIRRYQKKFNIPTEYFIESDLGDLQTCAAISPAAYAKVKRKLPRHQILAVAQKSSSSSRSIHYVHSMSSEKSYASLPQILETNQLDYSLALEKWLDQF